MTDKEIKECIDDSEIYQTTVDSLIDQLHDLISQGNIGDAKVVADRIRQLQSVG
jgi:protein-arginine kinase activator protein McsA